MFHHCANGGGGHCKNVGGGHCGNGGGHCNNGGGDCHGGIKCDCVLKDGGGWL